MIITKLIGGRGNQMFQYAAGRAVALRNGTVLKLDVSNFDKEGIPRREYALNVFNIQENFASQKEINNVKLTDNILLQKSPRLRRFLASFNNTYINEGYTSGEIPIGNNSLYLDGYWQSEDYFKDYEIVIRKDFTFNSLLSKKAVVWKNKIAAEESVSIQVRRTDYVNRPKGGMKIIGCSQRFYKNAVEYIINRFPTAKFFVVSDDIKWCRQNIRFGKYEFNYIDVIDIEQLRLMSLCRHHIIANSTFGWWGAWLGTYPKKTVIAPDPWFKDRINFVHKTVPLKWIKIKKLG